MRFIFQQLYAEISSLLHDHQDLVDDFATFLLAHQAVECGCFVAYIQYQQLREFFRKLEVNHNIMFVLLIGQDSFLLLIIFFFCKLGA